MYNVLCVCTGNICRSPMAEGLLKHLLPDDLQGLVNVHSAGTHALHGNVAENNAVIAMQSFGVEISHHRARLVTADMVKDADLILAMEKGHIQLLQSAFRPHRERLRLLGEFDPAQQLEEIEDPYGRSSVFYSACAQDIHSCLTGVIHDLCLTHGIECTN